MSKISIAAASIVTVGDLASARLGSRFGRLDLQSQLALLAVESLRINFDALPRERIAVCLAAAAGSLATDVDFWKGRDAVGGPSPTLFAYTLPSATIGEVAIRFRLTGPNLCLVGPDSLALSEAAHLIEESEADGCVCVACEVVTADAAKVVEGSPAASACALFLQEGGNGLHELREIDRDMKTLCALFCARK